MLSPSNPPFDHEHQHRLPITKDAAEAVNHDVDSPMPFALAGRRRRADTSPRARRKKDHQDDPSTLERISKLSEDEGHIMKDYAGNTLQCRLETLAKLEEYRQRHGAPPIKADGPLGPKRGKTGVNWICGLCSERKNTFQKIAGHITSHHWKLKVWKCLDSSCGRNYCSLNELTRHTKETHRAKRPERSNLIQNLPIQSNLRASAAPDSTPPATYRSGSNYSDGLSPPRLKPSYSPPIHLPPGSVEFRDATQEQAHLHRYSTRSSRPAPYASQDSRYARFHSSSSALPKVAQPRNQQKRQAYRNAPSMVDRRDPPPSHDHIPYQDMSKSHYIPAMNKAFNTATQVGASSGHRSTNSTDGTASHAASSSYSEGYEASSHPKIASARYYDRIAHPTDRYHVEISDGPTPRAGSHQDHFQQQNYTTQANMHSNYAKYPSTLQTTDDLALFSAAPDFVQTIPRQTSPTTYGTMEKGLYNMAPYSSVPSFDNQSGPGQHSDETFDTYLSPFDVEHYALY